MGNQIATAVAFLLVMIYFLMIDDFKLQPETIKNRRVLVTGASSGIGEQVAYEYAKLGAKLIITARRSDLLQKVSAKCKELGASQIEMITADMASAKDREHLIQETESRLGGLDILILNHATLRSAWWTGAGENVTLLSQDLEVNFISFTDLVSKAIQLLTFSEGQIGVLSSSCGILSCPTFAPYAASKFALHGFFTSLRQEFILQQRPVTITLCILGQIATDDGLGVIRQTQPDYEASSVAPVEDCAQAIIRGVAAGRRSLHYPSNTFYMDWAHRIFPEYMENRAAKNVLRSL